jgi:hypothetical protein
MYSMYVLYKIKKHIFTSKLFGYIKTFKTKNVFKFFQFCFLYSVQGAWCGGRRKFTVLNFHKPLSYLQNFQLIILKNLEVIKLLR